MQLLVGVVYAELLEAIDVEVLEAKDVENTNVPAPCPIVATLATLSCAVTIEGVGYRPRPQGLHTSRHNDMGAQPNLHQAQTESPFFPGGSIATAAGCRRQGLFRKKDFFEREKTSKTRSRPPEINTQSIWRWLQLNGMRSRRRCKCWANISVPHSWLGQAKAGLGQCILSEGEEFARTMEGTKGVGEMENQLGTLDGEGLKKCATTGLYEPPPHRGKKHSP